MRNYKFRIKNIKKMDKELCKFMKKCKSCGKLKLMIKFTKDKRRDGGRTNKCYNCKNKNRKKYKHICKYCNEEFKGEKNQQFCNEECYGKWQSENLVGENNPRYGKEGLKGKNNPNWKGGEVLVKCDYCGEDKYIKQCESERSKHHFCDKECYNKWQKNNPIKGKDSPRYSRIETECDYCGKTIPVAEFDWQYYEHHFCNNECQYKWRSENIKGKSHPNWKGGITLISDHLRKYIKPWKINSMEYCNYKSIISGKRFNHIHHVNKNFSEILELTFKISNIEIKETIVEYTSEELEKLEKICLMLHYFFGPGVCLTEEEHKLFHSLYGKHDNTKEQFKEFEERFQNGEFIE